MAKQTKTKRILKAVGHEIKVNPPKVLTRTRRKYGLKRAEDQRVAILLSKARKAGARVPKRRKKKKR